MHGQPSVTALIEECRRVGLPGIVPSERFSLAAVPELLLAELEWSRRGVIVLAVDGLSHGAAARSWPSAEITYLTSTLPSTSATAWLTALTGSGPEVHGVPGMVYRVDASVVYAVTGEVVAGQPPVPPQMVLPQPTVFERAAAAGARCLALGRELDHLPGPWARALQRGTVPVGLVARPPAALAAQAADPRLLVDAVCADVTAVLAEPASLPEAAVLSEAAGPPEAAEAPVLLWVYVNLDDHVHANGYDDAVLAALRRLDGDARDWADRGWTVIAHSDHGQVRVRPDPALARAWALLDDSGECELPGGGAGRVRWLYPRPGREDVVHARLADALGNAAVVVRARDLGLPPHRVGAVVAIAASDRFPVPNPALRYEHGGLDVDEMVIPFAVWRPR
jgi:type I phosphodiesterase/nucleotide pyrophosphatase